MRKALLLILTIAALSSCGTLKKNSKKEKTETKTETVTTSVDTRTVTEVADTTFVVKADSVTGTIGMVELERGDTLIVENDGALVEVHFDAKTRKVKAKSVSKKKPVNVKFKRATVSNTVTRSKEKKETATKTHTKDKERTSGMAPFFWGGGITLLLLLLIYLAYRYFKKQVKLF